MCIPTFVDFFLFHLFYFLCLFCFLFLFSLSRWLRVLMAFFFSFSVRLSASKLPCSQINSNFFFFIRFFLYPGLGAIITLPSSPPHALHPLSQTFSLLGRRSTSGPRGVTHISCHYKNTIEGVGENRRTNEQTRTMLGVNSREGGELRNTLHS